MLQYKTIHKGQVEVRWIPVDILWTKNAPIAKTLEEKQGEIDAAWEEALKERPHLTNGSLPIVVDHKDRGGKLVVTVFFVEYKVWIAQRSGVELGLKPIGVSGLIELSENGEKFIWNGNSWIKQKD